MTIIRWFGLAANEMLFYWRQRFPAQNSEASVMNERIAMLSRIVFILPLAIALSVIASGQAKLAEDSGLPKQLSETEVQRIIKHNNPKSHVEAALKISDARLAQAVSQTQANQYQTAVEEVDVYASLIIYANDYTRKLPEDRIKDRNKCLKKIEQAIFKQSRNLEFINREIPFTYRESVEDKINEVKKIRVRAIDDMLGGGKSINSSNKK